MQEAVPFPYVEAARGPVYGREEQVRREAALRGHIDKLGIAGQVILAKLPYLEGVHQVELEERPLGIGVF
ncbi:hypothetical protein MOMUL_30660 [Moorella mulderi DSM 14980]|uniref:Uncharacterized protein n=1 Tax=Moorella mulderi DSM 14980 TaxID=1122241 RepID=A0A151ASC7_9FIRM|nr:hypothetical protein MOMUL_30660 [Moorella mulderi DSM 14980]